MCIKYTAKLYFETQPKYIKDKQYNTLDTITTSDVFKLSEACRNLNKYDLIYYTKNTIKYLTTFFTCNKIDNFYFLRSDAFYF